MSCFVKDKCDKKIAINASLFQKNFILRQLVGKNVRIFISNTTGSFLGVVRYINDGVFGFEVNTPEPNLYIFPINNLEAIEYTNNCSNVCPYKNIVCDCSDTCNKEVNILKNIFVNSKYEFFTTANRFDLRVTRNVPGVVLGVTIERNECPGNHQERCFDEQNNCFEDHDKCDDKCGNNLFRNTNTPQIILFADAILIYRQIFGDLFTGI